MSGVWRERSVPMTDHECAVEALEEVGATILAILVLDEWPTLIEVLGAGGIVLGVGVATRGS